MAFLLLAVVVVTGACTKTGGSGPRAEPAPTGKTEAKLGGKYKGKVQRGYEITFEVSADGKQVTKVAANVLETCTGSSTSRTSQLYWDGPFSVGSDGTVTAEGEDPQYKGIQYRFTAKLGADGSASGTVLQKGGGCTTYELQWTANKE